MKVVCDRQVGRRELLTAWLDPLAITSLIATVLLL